MLSNDANIVIPTEPEVLANLLWSYAVDWSMDLEFLNNLARMDGRFLDKRRVAEIIHEKIENGEE